ncbi:uncharacterized protein LOC125234760 isoform X2 [Leguminivora glycinivorella]|uniref:uncharacterized protein LOC125234760 isoform X2 n=1 Tax=Leguminivora glycinivorella TaxID=1035111 RepID=UPI00200F18AE|nr:uncharacterized protein LOC125234760 isoform X2 [Leguminivora glycinivorella]
MIDWVNKNLRALKTLKLPTEHWDILIIHMMSSKLDSVSMRDWETERNKIVGIPTYSDFITFLKGRADLLETMEEAQTQSKVPRRHSDVTHNRPRTFIANDSHKQKQHKCPVCTNYHTIYQCPKFKALPIESRIDNIKQLNLCTNCLRAGHDEQRCRLSSCRLCTKRHNTMLHIDTQSTEPLASTSNAHVQDLSKPVQDNITLNSIHRSRSRSQTLLSTAIINIQDHTGQTHKVRVLLDNGSTISFITESLRNQLGLPSYPAFTSVKLLEDKSSTSTQRCDVTISSLYDRSYTTDVDCFVLSRITDVIHTDHINRNSFEIPSHIHLADPSFADPSEVQMLLSADLFWDVLIMNKISLGKNRPLLVESRLGWLVVKLPNNNKTKQNTVHCHFSNAELDHKLNYFFDNDGFSTIEKVSTKAKSDSECERIFTSTTTRHSDGKFIVTVPLKESPEVLGNSKEQALTRFHSLERKFKREPEFKDQYTKFINEYIQLGHMSENTTPENDDFSYFLPHHAILRESLTTKLRSVFDGSAVTSSGKSYNDIQHIGPVVQDDLLSILIRFRQHRFVATSDVAKMYRQIYVREDQRSLQQILWRPDPTQQISLLIKGTLTPKDKLIKLNPFIDQDNLIRVGGRLSNSNYDYDTKHPILLHASHYITKTLVRYYHIVYLHAGPQLLLSTLRHKFWIISGRNLCRKTTHECLTCLRFSGRTYQPIMSPLPAQRLHADHPFTHTATDYAGPILISNRKGRGAILIKAYIVVFVCLAVRAVHLELVTDLTSQGFIAALNRFIARRGKPAILFSDNGTQYVGSCNELAKFLKENSKDITTYSAQNEIKFRFAPAYSPNFNGLVEGSVKSLKHHLKRVLSMTNLDYENMNSTLIQIEGILNSRPLTPLSSDPSDLIPLCPAHFLIGRTITMPPAPQVEETRPLTTLSRYMRVQQLKAHFWKRYSKEYISELQSRSKWRTQGAHPQLGEMVVVKDDRLPPNRWLLGRVTAIHPGSDGVNRVADVLTTTGTLRRAYNRLCPLPSTLDQAAPDPRGAAC